MILLKPIRKAFICGALDMHLTGSMTESASNLVRYTTNRQSGQVAATDVWV